MSPTKIPVKGADIQTEVCNGCNKKREKTGIGESARSARSARNKSHEAVSKTNDAAYQVV